MSTKFKISFSFFILMQIAFVGFAQVNSGQSRLNIGAQPKANINTSPVTPLVLKKTISSEVKLDNTSAITDFYRKLLLDSSKKQTTTSNKLFYNNSENNDNLYSSEQFTISNIYPNPANDYANLDYSLKSRKIKAQLSFYNILGGQVEQVDLDEFEKQIKVNVRNWDNGVYFYQLLIDGKKVATKKLLVRHN